MPRQERAPFVPEDYYRGGSDYAKSRPDFQQPFTPPYSLEAGPDEEADSDPDEEGSPLNEQGFPLSMGDRIALRRAERARFDADIYGHPRFDADVYGHPGLNLDSEGDTLHDELEAIASGRAFLKHPPVEHVGVGSSGRRRVSEALALDDTFSLPPLRPASDNPSHLRTLTSYMQHGDILDQDDESDDRLRRGLEDEDYREAEAEINRLASLTDADIHAQNTRTRRDERELAERAAQQEADEDAELLSVWDDAYLSDSDPSGNVSFRKDWLQNGDSHQVRMPKGINSSPKRTDHTHRPAKW